VWSPDRTQLSFTVVRSATLPSLWLANVRSGRRRLVLSGPRVGGDLQDLRWVEKDSKLGQLGAHRIQVAPLPGSSTNPQARNG
jgi:hypothetical protein